MRKVIMLAVLLSTAWVASYAQQPVEWKHWVKKITDKTFELHMKATIKKGWHLYAQQQPKSGIAMPTTFAFTSNPLIVLNGKIKETGKLETSKDEMLGVEQNYYSNSVDFVQVIQLKAKVKTNIGATAKYQACNDEMCLPMVVSKFTIKVDG